MARSTSSAVLEQPRLVPPQGRGLRRTLAILLAGVVRARLDGSTIRSHGAEGYLAAHNGGVEVLGELTLEVENSSSAAIGVDEIARLEVIGADGRRRARTQAAARVVTDAGEADFDRQLRAGERTVLRFSLLVDEVEPGEEVRLRGRLGTERGTLEFETAAFTVGAILA
jgi:hypothetical protein